MSTQVEALVEQAVFGEQVDIFMRSRVGQWLLERAFSEADEALQRLKVVQPTDSVAVQQLQNQVWRAESIKGWLEQAVISGLKATEVLDERDE